MIHAVLSNPDHPEYGQATIPFPIPTEEYDHVLEVLAPLGIGDTLQRDCRVDKLSGEYPILKRLEDTNIDLDELDYLAKRLDSFTDWELAQFQGMAVKRGISDMTDFINLTFCCQKATVITDFSDLEAIGRAHYMAKNGGCATTDEMERLDARYEALNLILNKPGTVTPYGVVYDNGMKMDQSYDGRHFPAYLYEPCMLMVALTSRQERSDTENITWLYLPAAKGQIERAMARSGIADPADMCFRFGDSMLPAEVDAMLDFRRQSIFELNDMAKAVSKLSPSNQKKLGAVVAMAEPEYASQVCHLAENLEQFEFAPGAHTPAEYGKYMIQESGHFEYDHNLDEFYDYERYGLQRMGQEYGMFTDRGYISYHGTVSLDELMMEDPAEQYQREQGLQMGGMA